MSPGINSTESQCIRDFPDNPQKETDDQLDRASGQPYRSRVELHKDLEFQTNNSQMTSGTPLIILDFGGIPSARKTGRKGSCHEKRDALNRSHGSFLAMCDCGIEHPDFSINLSFVATFFCSKSQYTIVKSMDFALGNHRKLTPGLFTHALR